MAFKGFVTDERVIVTTKDLLAGRVKKIKYKKGFTNADITSDHGTTAVYTKILFKLLELMIMDVIEGHIVYFSKKAKSIFYIDFRQASRELLLGKGAHKDMNTPLVDFKKTKYRMPIVSFDPGYVGSEPCMVFVPSYLYSMLIDKVNAGTTYIKSNKDFWFNKIK